MFADFKKSVSSALLCVFAGLLAGCGDAPPPGSDESQRVAAVVASVNDAAGDEQAFQGIFVGGSVPENRGSYFSASIEMVGEPSVDGDQATAVVNVSQGAAEMEGRGSKMENETIGSGEVTWTLQRDGEEWKLKDAPLP